MRSSSSSSAMSSARPGGKPSPFSTPCGGNPEASVALEEVEEEEKAGRGRPMEGKAVRGEQSGGTVCNCIELFRQHDEGECFTH